MGRVSALEEKLDTLGKLMADSTVLLEVLASQQLMGKSEGLSIVAQESGMKYVKQLGCEIVCPLEQEISNSRERQDAADFPCEGGSQVAEEGSTSKVGSKFSPPGIEPELWKALYKLDASHRGVQTPL